MTHWSVTKRIEPRAIFEDGKLYRFAYLHGKRKWYVQVPGDWTQSTYYVPVIADSQSVEVPMEVMFGKGKP